jgi:hypothetical protein
MCDAFDSFSWCLRDVRALRTPIPHKGGQGLRRCPPALAARILEEAA